MCGIIGYVGFKDARSILISGLKRLEYRGYDSAGMAVLSSGRLSVIKTVGKVKKLVKLLGRSGSPGTIGIAHTCWATHGEPSTVNAHPHVDSHNKIALVHNGIIENYQTLRNFLKRRGATCKTDTDIRKFWCI